MRFKAAILGVVLTVLGASAASAAGFWLGLEGGAGFPTGDFSDVGSTGWNAGGTGTYMVNDQFGLGADVKFHSWSASDDFNDVAVFITGDSDAEFKWSAIQAGAHAVWAPPMTGMVRPYGKVGVGIYNVKLKLESDAGDDDDSESEVGFNLGAGLNFVSSGNMSWGINGAYHLISAEDDLGADINFFTVGVSLGWSVSPMSSGQ